MGSIVRSEVDVLADQVALVDAAADFAILKAQADQGRALVAQIARRLAPDVVTSEEAVHRALPEAIRAVRESHERVKGARL